MSDSAQGLSVALPRSHEVAASHPQEIYNQSWIKSSWPNTQLLVFQWRSAIYSVHFPDWGSRESKPSVPMEQEIIIIAFTSSPPALSP